jgi:hypothetical protein
MQKLAYLAYSRPSYRMLTDIDLLLPKDCDRSCKEFAVVIGQFGPGGQELFVPSA